MLLARQHRDHDFPAVRAVDHPVRVNARCADGLKEQAYERQEPRQKHVSASFANHYITPIGAANV